LAWNNYKAVFLVAFAEGRNEYNITLAQGTKNQYGMQVGLSKK
jgi:hypothetical protein